MESPRKTQAKVRSTGVSTDLECSHQDAPWDSSEIHSSDFGDTVSVSDLILESQDNWNSQDLIKCRGCITTKFGSMTRSLTVSNTPGTGFNPAWIMESCEHHIRNTICCNISVISHSCHSDVASSKSASDDSGCRSRAISPCGLATSCMHQLEQQNPQRQIMPPVQPKPAPPEIVQYENYDTPRSLAINLKDENQTRNRLSMASSTCSELEYYDTPRNVKEVCNTGPCHSCSCRCNATSPPPSLCCQPPSKRECGCHPIVICPCQKMLCQPKPRVLCSCCQDGKIRPASVQFPHESCPNGAIYAQVDMMKKTKRKVTEPGGDKEGGRTPGEVVKPHYENLHFAESLEHYENVRELKSRLGGADSCHCERRQEEDYLPMGPVPGGIGGVGSPMRCPCAKPAFPPPLNDGSRSATASPALRCRDPSSAYLNDERRRIAQIRRRSNSMDSGRCVDGLECITERTVSSQNTLTANSNSNSVDSLPSEKSDPPRQPQPASSLASPVQRHVCPPVLRRASNPTTKSNRDSSSSNDSGVSTGSLRNFGAGFLEFETIVTPLSKVRAQSLGATRELTKSKSSDPLEELSFRFNRAELKSSSAEAEVPICPPKKESKDISVSSSSGAVTIPYVDSISTSSGASDMSDYIETLSMSSFSSSEHDNLRQCHSAVTMLRPRSGKEYQKIDRINMDEAKHKLRESLQHFDSPSPGYGSSTSSN